MSKKEYSGETLIGAMVLVGPVASALNDKGLIAEPKDEKDPVRRLELIEQGVQVIRDVCDDAFKKTEEAQAERKKVEAFLIEKHYEFFGTSPFVTGKGESAGE